MGPLLGGQSPPKTPTTFSRSYERLYRTLSDVRPLGECQMITVLDKLFCNLLVVNVLELTNKLCIMDKEKEKENTNVVSYLKTDESRRYLKDNIIQPVGQVIYNEWYIYLWLICIYHVILIFIVLANLILLLTFLSSKKQKVEISSSI